ncbi:MAG: 2-oxoglutarate dehydrogenase E1 component [Rhodospirillaceae bacterium]|nr:2-oxoglutarate dehydrogenase E1 component [Rhodospirillaceae bacterium]
MPIEENSFLFGANETYIAELYARYAKDPSLVDAGWADFFDGIGEEGQAILADLEGASWAPRGTKVIGGGNGGAASMSDATAGGAQTAAIPQAAAAPDQIRQATSDSIRALMVIRNYRVRGHLHSQLDPLGLVKPIPHSELDPETYGFTERDLDRPIFLNYVLGLESASMRQIIKILEETYCGKVGVEYMHIQEADEKAWIQERIESIRNSTSFTDLGKRTILQRLTEAECFEKYLDRKHTGSKRFGLDGGESVVPAIEQILKRGAQLGFEEVLIGMPHRGRLNILANILNKPYRAIFSEFAGNASSPEGIAGSGDVKYHLGTSSNREFDNKNVHLSLLPNPSHLEAVNTVVLGKVRAKQRERGDTEREKVAALLLHGDASFPGQGVVPETFDLSQLRGYQTGGTIHFIVNNQIGFTTSPSYSRSSPYCSDVAKMVAAPILHVNGDDPEACVHIARIATEYRQKFKKDVVIDLWCYRRHGHNESDEPMFTQPRMYKKIAQHPTTRQLYADKLEADGVLEPGEGDRIVAQFVAELDAEFEASASYKPNKANWLEGRWEGLQAASGDDRRGDTAVPMKVLQEVGHAISEPPKNMNINRKILRQLDAKRKMFETGEGVDWATGEAIALGTLLIESTQVRLSGEDCRRGTFSQRHAVLIDQDTEETYIPVNHIRFGQAPFEVIDSPLSEFGVLGFEYGYSSAEPHALVIWEAQFGDFANGAQVIIDQFISSGETKWLRMNGLVMLLPHGYEGQGPEHSSARLERYLQLCGEDNMQVCNITSPANYFHVLRRQVHRDFRKPLIIMTPKSLLRHKGCVSRLDDFATGTSFHRVLWDDAQLSGQLAADNKIRRVVMCSGKVYFDLFEEREKRGLKDVYIMRLEQLFPFPRKALREELARFKKAEVVWCQEEPENMGAWTFVDRKTEAIMRELDMDHHRPRYVGRAEAAAPATGLMSRHLREQAALVDESLTLPPVKKTTTAKPATAKKATVRKATAKPAARKRRVRAKK